jgi:tetratricopeptide (TPR) repeat protein
MTERGLSRRELIRRRRSSGFVGRQSELNVFKENLARKPGDPDYQFLFHVHGNAGVGKTWLVRQWEAAAAEAGAATAYLDDSVHSPLGAMEMISAQLARQGLELKRFDRMLGRFRQNAHEAQIALAAEQEASESGAGGEARQASGSSTLLAQAGLAGLGMLPVVGVLAGSVDPAPVAQAADRMRAAVGARMRSHEDVRLVLDPVGRLTPVFLEDLAGAASGLPWMVLIFDVYERSGPTLDDWLCAVAAAESTVELPLNVQIVVSGQGPLTSLCWEAVRDLTVDVPLEVFTEAEARSLLAHQGISDEQVVEVILRLSGRLPVLVHMLAQSRPRSAGDVDDPSGTAVGRFLKWERDPARRAAASLCALPLQLDEDVYRRTVPDESAAPYSWIRTLAFVSDRNGQCRYHHVVRASMLRLQRAQSPARWRAAHEAFAEIHRERRETRETESSADDHWEDAEWRTHRLNETYHRLCADPQRALPWALLETAQSCGLRDGSVRRWAQMILQAGQDTDDVRLTEWGRRLTEASGEAQTVDAVPVLDTLLGHPGLTTGGEASTRAVRGQAHLDAHRPEQALADFTAAITLEPQQSGLFIDRAFTHIRLDRRDEALEDMDRAVRLDPDSSWVYLCRGYARRWAGDSEGAVEDFTTVIGLDPEHDAAWAMRGNLLRLSERYEEAITDLDRALAIDPRYGWAYYERSLCLRMLDRWDETMRDLRRYVEVVPDDVWGRVGLADALLSTGRYAQALQEIDSALAATGEVRADAAAWPHVVRAWALHGLGQDAEALAALERAETRDNTRAEIFAQRGWLLWEAGRLDEAEAAFDRALSGSPSYPWSLAGRGVVQLYGRRYEEATDSLAKAFAIQFGLSESDAEIDLARPVVSLLQDHLPANREAITAAVRLIAQLAWQQQWPHLARQITSVLALRPSPRLLLGGARLLRQIVTVLNARSEEGDARRIAWSLRFLGPVQRILDRLPEAGRRSQGGNG